MAPRVTPTPIDADNLSGSTMPAVPIDWRSGDADSMSARATYSEPTTDAGYTTAGSTQSVDHSINLLRWRGSPYRRGLDDTLINGTPPTVCVGGDKLYEK